MTEDSAYLIGLDLGTSAVKGVLMHPSGRIEAEAACHTRLLRPREGFVESDPEQHYDLVCAVIRELAAKAPGVVTALSMAAASGNTLLTDEHGIPLSPIINWMDRRAELDPPDVLHEFDPEEVARITGWPCVTTFPIAQLAWLRARCPDTFVRAAHIGMDTDWLVFRLTGKRVMDRSTAATFHLVEQVSGRYYGPFLAKLGVPREKLPVIVESGTPVGRLTPDAAQRTGLAADTILVAGSFDHPAAARAVGVLEPGQMMLSCGTSWVGFVPWTERAGILSAGMLCDTFLSAGGGAWGGMFSVPYIGQTIEWYIRNVIASGEPDPMRVFDESAASARAGADGLEIDLTKPPERIDGDRANISRAVMEGAVRLLNEKIEQIRARGFVFRRAAMVGGPASSSVWPRIVEELTGLEVIREGRSAGARGAAMLAGIGAGIYRDERHALSVWQGSDTPRSVDPAGPNVSPRRF